MSHLIWLKRNIAERNSDIDRETAWVAHVDAMRLGRIGNAEFFIPSDWLAMYRTSRILQIALLMKESTCSNIRHIIVTALTRRGRSSICDLQ